MDGQYLLRITQVSDFPSEVTGYVTSSTIVRMSNRVPLTHTLTSTDVALSTITQFFTCGTTWENKPHNSSSSSLIVPICKHEVTFYNMVVRPSDHTWSRFSHGFLSYMFTSPNPRGRRWRVMMPHTRPRGWWLYFQAISKEGGDLKVISAIMDDVFFPWLDLMIFFSVCFGLWYFVSLQVMLPI